MSGNGDKGGQVGEKEKRRGAATGKERAWELISHELISTGFKG